VSELCTIQAKFKNVSARIISVSDIKIGLRNSYWFCVSLCVLRMFIQHKHQNL